MRSDRFSRRSMLASIGGAAALLPLFDPPRARGATFPKRLVIIQTTNGVIHDAFWPKSTDRTAFELDSQTLKPLAPHKKDLILIGGLELRAGLEDKSPMAGGLGHKSLPHLLTGNFGTAGRASDGRADVIGNQISIDQHIALALQKKPETQTRFKSLELGILTSLAGPRGDNGGFISFNGPAIGSNPARVNGNRPEESPYKLYDRMFSAGVQPGQGAAAIDPDALARYRDEKKSAIDFVGQELKRLQANLGAEERQKLEAHLDAVRRLEQELSGGTARPAGMGCAPPAKSGTMIDLTKASSMPAASKAMFDVLAPIIACDLTRVVTVMMSNNSNEDLAMYWLGAGFDGPPAAVGAYKVRDHHNLAHTPGFRTQKIRADQWFVEQFTYLVELFKKVPEGNGTMLDNSVIWLANNMDNGGNHTVRGMPWVLAGSCGGALKTGQYLRFGDWGASSPYRGSKYIPHNGLLVSLANAMGVPTEKFGRYDDGELAGLRA